MYLQFSNSSRATEIKSFYLNNRVVHGSNFQLIFKFIFNLILYLKFKNVFENDL